MFCPNCATKIEIEQNFCRLCGLKLDDVLQVIAKQIPTNEYAKLQKRKDLFERFGFASLTGFSLVGFGFIFFGAIYYKLILFGFDVLKWSGIAAFIILGLLTAFFFCYSRLFMNLDKVNLRLLDLNEEVSIPTNKLLEEKPFETIPSVTENSTDLLFVETKTKKL